MHAALILLLTNTAMAWFMTGLIWFVQVVHYPQFKFVGSDAFGVYHAGHTRLTTWVVGPPMLIEMASAVGLAVFGGSVISPIISWIGLILLGIVWLSTASLQVPWHDVLSKGWNDRAVRLLCGTNWIRTIGWSVRAVLMTYAIWRFLLAQAGRPGT